MIQLLSKRAVKNRVEERREARIGTLRGLDSAMREGAHGPLRVYSPCSLPPRPVPRSGWGGSQRHRAAERRCWECGSASPVSQKRAPRSHRAVEKDTGRSPHTGLPDRLASCLYLGAKSKLGDLPQETKEVGARVRDTAVQRRVLRGQSTFRPSPRDSFVSDLGTASSSTCRSCFSSYIVYIHMCVCLCVF